MQAVGIRAFGGRDRLEVLEVPRPEPGPGQVRIRIAASGVNPIDVKIREGLRQDRLPHVFPVVLGWEAAGTVDALGAGESRFAEGDPVFAYARQDVVHDGTYAEAVVLPASQVAHAPRSIDAVHAACVPLAGLTAWQALDALRLQPGETLLVHAAAGGVGSFAVQLALLGGARVLGTASPANHAWLEALGCDVAIDYRAGPVHEAVRRAVPTGVDAVLDGAGGAALHENLAAMRDGGRLVTLVEQPTDPRFSERGLVCSWIFAAPDGAQLAGIAALLDAGRLRVHVEDVFPLAEAARAHERLETRHVRGKLALQVGR
jgi:NADPH2:quinone reductase